MVQHIWTELHPESSPEIKSCWNEQMYRFGISTGAYGANTGRQDEAWQKRNMETIQTTLTPQITQMSVFSTGGEKGKL